MRSPLFRSLTLVAACLFTTLQVLAETYPSKPVRIVQPFPGGPIDGSLRAIAEKLSAKWGQPVIIEAKPGGSEVIAGEAVAKAAPDGYTIFVGTDSNFINNQFIFGKMPFDPVRDLVPVTQLYDLRFGLFVRGDLKVNNLQEFVAVVKNKSARHTFASSGVGGSMHLAMEAFKIDANIDMLHVPYKQAPQIVQDLLNGSVDAVMATAQVGAPFIPSGKIKMLAVSGPERLKILPDVPTFAELGYPKGGLGAILGVAVPRGTPEPIIRKLYEDIRAVITTDDFRTRVLEPNGYVAVGSSPAQFAQWLKSARVERERLIRQLGIKLD